MHKEFPKWLYKFGSDESKIVNSQEEADALGKGWVTTPKPSEGWPDNINKVAVLKPYTPKNYAIGVPEGYVPVEYPKWVNGVLVENFEQELKNEPAKASKGKKEPEADKSVDEIFSQVM
jgi:hypothetical protein